ncbi:VCBS domain-containing protein, partial [Marinomonas transparens]
DAPLSWSGTLTATDVDNEDNTFIAKTTIGENGTFSVDANGEWTFNANSAFDELNVGESAVEEFTVTTAGGTEQVVTMTITGTNDGAVIGGDTSVTASETDTALTLNGALTSSDVDNADNTFTPNTIYGKHGKFNIDTDGNWTFNAYGTFDEMSVGQSREETFEVTSVDGTKQDVTVTINGTNDAPEIVVTTVTAFNENEATVGTIVANFHISDAEDGVSSFGFTPGSNDAGYYSLHGDSKVVLTQAGVDAVNNGVVLPKVSITTIDTGGLTAVGSVTPTYIAQNDAPVAEADIASGTQDGGVITINVLANDSDVDGDMLTIIGATVPAEQGTVAIVDGQLEFTPADNFHGEATISYTISDGTVTDTADVTVTVTDNVIATPSITLESTGDDGVYNAAEL